MSAAITGGSVFQRAHARPERPCGRGRQTFGASACVALAAIAIASSASAQAQAQPTAVTLEQAIQQAQVASQRLAQLQAQEQAADFAVEGARAAARPEVALQGGYMRTNHVDQFAIALPGFPAEIVYPDIPDNYRSRIDLQWPIYTGGRTDALAAAARAERSATGHDLDAARADLRLEVTRAFWALVTAQETEAVLARSIGVADAHLNDLRASLASGLISPEEVSKAEAEASHQRVLATEAANQRAIAEADLRRLTQNLTPGRLTPDAGAAAGVVSEPPGLQHKTTAELIAAAVAARPERRALTDRVVSADARVRAAAAVGRPQIAADGGYDYARPNPRIFPRSGAWNSSWDASVNVSWLLWDGGRRAADVGQARAQAAALKAQVTEFDRQLSFDVQARELDLDASRQAVTAAGDEVRAAMETERVVGERYRAGVATNTDVLDAEEARLQADLDRTRAIANMRLAQARLERTVGY